MTNDQIKHHLGKKNELEVSLRKAKQEEEQMNQMKNQIKEDSDELSDITPKILALQAKQKDIESQILEVGGTNYKSQKDLVDKLG